MTWQLQLGIAVIMAAAFWFQFCRPVARSTSDNPEVIFKGLKAIRTRRRIARVLIVVAVVLALVRGGCSGSANLFCTTLRTLGLGFWTDAVGVVAVVTFWAVSLVAPVCPRCGNLMIRRKCIRCGLRLDGTNVEGSWTRT